MPVSVSAASTADRPTRLISMSVAVLSLMAIILVAASSTEIWVPSGSFCSTPEGRLLSCALTVSGRSQLTFPEATASPRAWSTYSFKTEPNGSGVSGSMLCIG
jgi:hypothetical protein